MARLKFPSPSVWEEFELETDIIDPPTVRLQVSPLFRKGQLEGFLAFAGVPRVEELQLGNADVSEFWPVFEKIIPIIMQHVIGWDITVEGKPIPCTDEEKAKPWFKDALMWEQVKRRIEPAEIAPPPGFDPGEDEPEDVPKKRPSLKFLWIELLTIIRNHENFRKN
jgi:hypothetical protein